MWEGKWTTLSIETIEIADTAIFAKLEGEGGNESRDNKRNHHQR